MSDNQIHLGRDTEGTMRNWEAIAEAIPVAPNLFLGERPKKTNNRKFIFPRYRGQLRGCCVGEGMAAGAEFMTRLPADKNPNSPPREGVALSALACYLQARLYSAEHGRSLGWGDGAFVGDAASSISDADGGLVRYEYYPSTNANYNNYSDRVRLSPEALADKTAHPVKSIARLKSPDQIFDALASGRMVIIGVSIPSGIQPGSIDPKTGRFRWQGRPIGGHCFPLVDYDLETGLAYVDNSWDNVKWGCQTGEYVRPLGITELDGIMTELTERKLNNGASEAIVYDDDGGWSPKLIYDNSW